MALKVEVTQLGSGEQRFIVSGNIDERTKPELELAAVKGDGVLDLSRIDRINSVGLVGWLRWISQVSQQHRLGIESLSYSLATLANQLSDLFGAARVRSCLAPYYCPKCNANHEMVVTRNDLAASPGGPPHKSCPTCQGPMDFDEMDEYFEFLRDAA